MPLTTTWTRSLVSKCGCAFCSLTRPCVAQRVWPMPTVALVGDASPRPSPPRPVDRPRRGGRGCRPRAPTRSPAGHHGDAGGVVAAVLELLAGPRAGAPGPACSPTYPTMPHMAGQGSGRGGAARASRPPDRRAGELRIRRRIWTDVGRRTTASRRRPRRARRAARRRRAPRPSVGASTITRTSCSVPLGAHEHAAAALERARSRVGRGVARRRSSRASCRRPAR